MTRLLALCFVVSTVVACGGGDDGPHYGAAHPRIYIEANRARLTTALTTPAGQRFSKMVDRWVSGQDVYNFQAWNAALMGQLTGDVKYCEAAVKAVDKQVDEATAAIATGAVPKVAHDSYLDIGDMIGDLALVYDWCSTTVGSRQNAWLTYANQAVWNVWHHEEANWNGKPAEWSGWSVENPSNNYHYSFLRATMLLGLAAHDDFTGADAWLSEFHDTRLMGLLVPTFEKDLVGGGSREGTGYGVAMRRLFELYDFWKASTGEEIASKTKHTRASMIQFMHQIVPTLDRIAPTGDHSRDSTAAFFDYHRNYLQELIALYPDDPQAGRARTLLDQSSVQEMENAFLFVYDFLYGNDTVAAKPLDGFGTAYHAPGIGELYARSSWDKTATWMNLIAGPYTESHAHQDQGSLMIYKEGWLAVDANIGSHSGLAQDTDAHGLVRITVNGESVSQHSGNESKILALHKGDGWLHVATDITPAYKNEGTVMKVQREIVYLEPDAFIVYDRVVTTGETEQVWQLPAPAMPSVNGDSATIANSAHTLHVQRLAPAEAALSTFTYGDDISNMFRLDSKVAGGDRRFLHTLWIDNAVTNVTPSTDSVSLTLSNGKVVSMTFSHDGVGGTLVYDGTNHALGAGVDKLAE